jgi:hypothetical protein
VIFCVLSSYSSSHLVQISNEEEEEEEEEE